jgi:hypothetical protein
VTADAGKGSTAALRANALLLLEDLENFEKLDAGESTIKLNWPTFARGASAVEWTGGPRPERSRRGASMSIVSGRCFTREDCLRDMVGFVILLITKGHDLYQSGLIRF